MKKYLEKYRNEKGQAGIEFIVVMVVVFFFLLFMLSLSIALVVSDYIEYATFMAARTYKAGASSPEKQFEHAQIVFDAYVEKIQGVARNFQLEESAIDPNDPQSFGLVATYDVDLFYLPPIFVTDGVPPSTITLSAEAFLGRDPAFTDCQNFFQNTANSLFGVDRIPLIEQMADNGC